MVRPRLSIRKTQEGNVLLVSSGGPIATSVGHVLGCSPETTIAPNLRILNCSVTEFAFTPLIEDDVAVPAGASLTVHQANPDFRGGVCALVDVPVEKYLGPAEKINITVPRMVLARIDEYVKSHAQRRSGFLVEAARQAMHV